jgi:hypothetical protein
MWKFGSKESSGSKESHKISYDTSFSVQIVWSVWKLFKQKVKSKIHVPFKEKHVPENSFGL